MIKNSYRIITDVYHLHHSEVKFWFLPVWVSIGKGYYTDFKDAEYECKRHAGIYKPTVTKLKI